MRCSRPENLAWELTTLYLLLIPDLTCQEMPLSHLQVDHLIAWEVRGHSTGCEPIIAGSSHVVIQCVSHKASEGRIPST